MRFGRVLQYSSNSDATFILELYRHHSSSQAECFDHLNFESEKRRCSMEIANSDGRKAIVIAIKGVIPLLLSPRRDHGMRTCQKTDF